MTLKEQIITELFSAENTANAEHIRDTFWKFQSMIDWEDFRKLLIEYRFEKVPKYFVSLQKRVQKAG